MAKARQKPSGKWEIGLRHPDLPGGRKYFWRCCPAWLGGGEIVLFEVLETWPALVAIDYISSNAKHQRLGLVSAVKSAPKAT